MCSVRHSKCNKINNCIINGQLLLRAFQTVRQLKVLIVLDFDA